MEMELTGLWRFSPDPEGTGAARGYAALDFDDRLWREVWLPADFEMCAPELDGYQGVGWFRRRVTQPTGWAGRRVALQGEGVNARVTVFVNDRQIGVWSHPWLPFEMELPEGLVQFGAEALIALRVDNIPRPEDVPGARLGWRNYGGLLREVRLVAGDYCRMAQVRTCAQPTEHGGTLGVEVLVINDRQTEIPVCVRARLTDGDGEVLVDSRSSLVTLLPAKEAVIELSQRIADVKPWTPESPTLYHLELSLLSGDETLGTRDLRIGFRAIEARDGKLWLNGEPLFLLGFNRHEDSPHTHMCPDLSLTRRDLAAMKEAGANFVRLCHYPHDRRELDLCDEMGLLAMAEIPLYWWEGHAEGEAVTQARLTEAMAQLETLIARDINHPSVIFWSVSNETHEELPEVVAGNEALLRRAKELDPTRLAVHVSDHWRASPHFDLDDVICVNGYPSLMDGSSGDEIFWREGLNHLHTLYPDKPILVTEFGRPALYSAYDGWYDQRKQAETIEREFGSFDAPYVCGATVWCWADHAWPPSTFSFCSRLAVSPFGVVTRDRRRKMAYFTVRRLFHARQGWPLGAEHPLQRGPAGYEVYMVRPHLRDIPVVPLPPGFRIRTMRPDDGALWTDIWRDAEPFMEIGRDLFQEQFGHDLRALTWRGFIVEDERGVGVATITAWYHRTFKGEDYGMIHWVAVRRAYWGRGLGKAMLSHALRQMAQWHKQAFLGTQTKRLAAIKLYLDFGFMPDLENDGAQEAWREVKTNLHHPVLERLDLT